MSAPRKLQRALRVEWYGQAAFRLSGRGGTVFVDPIGDTSGLATRGIKLDYPPLAGVNSDLVLVVPAVP